jgi:hypothetical protein
VNEAATPIEVVIPVGDLHCGSVVGLCPPEVTLDEGQKYRHNLIQKWTWECWMDFCYSFVPSVVRKRQYAVVVNGDAIDGVHHGGHELVTTEESLHIAIAVECLKHLTENAAKVFVVKGTPTHVKRTSESSIGAMIGAEQDPDTGQFAAYHWLLNIRGCPVSFRHHMSTSTRASLYGTGLSVHLAEEQIQAVRYGQTVPRVVVRSHRHTPGLYRDDKAMAVSLPAWQGLTSFGHKVVPAAVNGVGGAALDWAGLGDGELPAYIPQVYRPARKEAVCL